MIHIEIKFSQLKLSKGVTSVTMLMFDHIKSRQSLKYKWNHKCPSTSNRSLYIPVPDPINWIKSVLITHNINDNTPALNKEIAKNLLTKEEIKIWLNFSKKLT